MRQKKLGAMGLIVWITETLTKMLQNGRILILVEMKAHAVGNGGDAKRDV